jgi:PAS domain S-box-containing protein
MIDGAAAVTAIYGLSAATAVPLGYVIWRHRAKTAALPLLGSIVGGGVWSLTLFLAAVTPDAGLTMLIERVHYVGVCLAVASVFLFTLLYTGREHLVTRRTVGLLAVEPLAVLALAFANPGNAFFASVTAEPSAVIGLDIEYGVAFQVHLVYSYAFVLAATALVLEMLYRSRALYRGQIAALLGGVLSPTVGNLVSLFELVSFNATPLGFVLTNLLFTVAITRYRLIDLAPIARDRVLDTVEDAVYVIDRDGRIVDVNLAAEDLTELTRGVADIVGRDVDDFLAERPKWHELYREIVETGEERSTEFSADGHHYEIDATRIDDGRGHHVGWLFLVSDVTDRVRRERELRRRNEQLDRFANIVSHDLRNPLTVANGYVDLARETGDEACLDEVDTTLDRMEAIIDDVLALAREGEAVTDPSSVDLRSAAEAAWGNVDTGESTLRIADDAAVSADRDRLVRLFENLFRNAVEHGSTSPDSHDRRDAVEHGSTNSRSETDDAIEHGTAGRDGADRSADSGMTVHVGTVEENGDASSFYVADDGPGIPPGDRDRVFDSGYTTAEDGTGFGLSIVEQIADAHGWEAEVTESETGGARFELRDVTVRSDGLADSASAVDD